MKKSANVDIKYHAALSFLLATSYLVLGGKIAESVLILAVGVGLDFDHVLAYLYYTRDFKAGFPGILAKTHSYYRRAMDWLYFRKGEPYTTLEVMFLHTIEFALLVFFLTNGSRLFLPIAVGYAGHMALDLLTWCHMVAGVGTRNLSQMATFFSLSYRLVRALKNLCARSQ